MAGAVDFGEILAYPYWRHRIDIGDGRVTPGVTPAADWDRLGLPADMSDRSFLDVGCFDGLHAFEAERRGSPEVLATDVWEPGGAAEWWHGRTPRRDGFELVRAALDSDVEGRRLDVYDLEPASVGTFDVVLCSKVLPFLPDPGGALERLASVAETRLVVESAVSTAYGRDERVLELAGETTENPNRWWHPTHATLRSLLDRAGCATVEIEPLESSATAEAVRDGLTEGVVSVSATPERTGQVDEVPPGHRVTILYELEDALRIQYRPSPADAYRQGWVDPAAVRPEPGRAAALLARARRRLRSDGVGGLTRATVRSLAASVRRRGHSNVVATGYF